MAENPQVNRNTSGSSSRGSSLKARSSFKDVSSDGGRGLVYILTGEQVDVGVR